MLCLKTLQLQICLLELELCSPVLLLCNQHELLHMPQLCLYTFLYLMQLLNNKVRLVCHDTAKGRLHGGCSESGHTLHALNL
jgi:hypothetical protein